MYALRWFHGLLLQLCFEQVVSLHWPSSLRLLARRWHFPSLWADRRPTASNQSVTAGPQQLSFRVVVLNLDRRRDRLLSFEHQLEQSQPWLLPKVCRLRAFDGHNATETQWLEDNGFIGAQWGPETALTAGMIGCYASHWQALKLIAEDKNIDFGVIAEDDLVRYSDDFEEQFSKLTKNTDGEAAHFWKHVDWVSLQQDGSGWLKGKPREARPTQLRLRTQIEWPKNTALYAVSREAARRLTSSSRVGVASGLMMPIRQELDTAIPMYLRRMWQFDPPIAQAKQMSDEDGDSDVQLGGQKVRHGTVAKSLLQLQTAPVIEDC